MLALQDNLAHGTTFEAALRSLLGGGLSTVTPAEPTAPSFAPGHPTAAPGTGDTAALIAEPSRDFDDYQTAHGRGQTRHGWAEAR